MANEFLDINGLAHFKDKIDQAHTQELDTALAGKQDVIQDLESIRAGATAGATAYQKPVGGIPASDLASGVIPDVSGFYEKPSEGIPKSDLSEDVRTSLGKADTALQSFTETDPTVPAWAKASSKPSYTAAEVGALPDDTEIPSALSDLSADSTHRLVTDTEKATWNSKQDAISDLETIRSGAAAGATAYQKPATGIPASDIAAGVIPDVSNFITKSVNDLVNYYTKSETYTQTEVNNLIGAIQQFHYEIVATLPASGAANILYLLGPTGSGADKYEEYVYANNAWVKIGDTSIDLSGYYQKPAGGIPASDLASAVQTSLGKADSALQSESDPVFSASAAANISSSDITNWDGKYTKPSGGIPAADIASGVIPTVPAISTNITTDATSDTKTTSPKAVKTYVDNAIPSVPVTDVTVGGTSVVSSGTAAIPAIPTVPTISTDISTDASSTTKTVAPKAVVDYTGDLANLSTTAKTTLVAAINEIAQGGGSSVEISTDVAADKASNAKATGAKAVYDFVKPASQSAQPAGGMLPGVLYNLGVLSGAVTISLAAPADASVVNEYGFTFYTGSTAPTITWPASITGWAGNCIANGVPNIAASKFYEVSVLNGIAAVMEV